MAKSKKETYKTIRIYAEDHDILLKTSPREFNFAEIIHQLIENKEKK